MTNLLVVSDFNAELVSRYLTADSSLPLCDATTAPYGQVFQSLAVGNGGQDALFVWTRPEGVLPAWQRQLSGEAVDLQDLLAEVDIFAEAVKAAATKHRLTLVGSWVRSRPGRGLGILDWSADGEALRLARLNLHLAEAFAGSKNIKLLNTQNWLDGATNGRDSKYWYSLKSPFTETVCRAAALDLKAALRATGGLARKLLVLDLDDTLWGGVVGDDGWESLKLGGHDPAGEAFLDFQKAVKALSQRGVALAIVSKNDETVALEAIDRHPEMAIRRYDLAGWRINWDDKAGNIASLAEELNLGLSAVVFVDDNPVERGRVREALPDVLVPEWPKDPQRYADALRALDCFDLAAITAEDRSRTSMYVADRSRRTAVTGFVSADDFQRSLDIQISVEELGKASIDRITQLLNKTNQMNLRNRRLTSDELKTWAGSTGCGLVGLRVSDRFGDLGLCGILSWAPEGEDLKIVDFILSCRAMGRRVEETMAHLAVERARVTDKNRVVAHLLPTARNRPCSEFWQKSGFAETDTNVFVWETARDYPRPEVVTLQAASVGH